LANWVTCFIIGAAIAACRAIPIPHYMTNLKPNNMKRVFYILKKIDGTRDNSDLNNLSKEELAKLQPETIHYIISLFFIPFLLVIQLFRFHKIW
jgi:hypothetical protein